MNEPRPRSRPSLPIVGAIGVVVCCAGPVLVAGGVVATIGGILRNPLVIAAGVVVLITAVTMAARHK